VWSFTVLTFAVYNSGFSCCGISPETLALLLLLAVLSVGSLLTVVEFGGWGLFMWLGSGGAVFLRCRRPCLEGLCGR
jgi:hypothetical protein